MQRPSEFIIIVYLVFSVERPYVHDSFFVVLFLLLLHIVQQIRNFRIKTTFNKIAIPHKWNRQVLLLYVEIQLKYVSTFQNDRQNFSKWWTTFSFYAMHAMYIMIIKMVHKLSLKPSPHSRTQHKVFAILSFQIGQTFVFIQIPTVHSHSYSNSSVLFHSTV